MTKSFLSYVELKKQATKDLEIESQEHDIEMGPSEEQSLSQFFQEVSSIKPEIEDLAGLLLDLRRVKDTTKAKSDMVSVLRKAKNIKARLLSLDQSNVGNRTTLGLYEEGSVVDRTRTSVTNGLRLKLRDVLGGEEGLRRSCCSGEGVEEIEGSLEELVQVFLDMGVLVEDSVVRTRGDVSGGANEIFHGDWRKKRDWTSWVGVFLLVVLFVGLVSTLVS